MVKNGDRNSHLIGAKGAKVIVGEPLTAGNGTAWGVPRIPVSSDVQSPVEWGYFTELRRICPDFGVFVVGKMRFRRRNCRVTAVLRTTSAPESITRGEER